MSQEVSEKKSNITVIQPYALTMAQHELSAIELRIMSIILLRLKDYQSLDLMEESKLNSDYFEDLRTVEIKQAEIVVGAQYSYVKEAIESLKNRSIKVRAIEKGRAGYWSPSLVEDYFYSDESSFIIVKLPKKLLPYFIEIGNSYTKYGLQFVFKTRSSHAIRWYQLGCHWLDRGYFTMKISEIRRIFQLEDKYPVFQDLKRRVITKPFEDINKYSDISISIADTVKKNRAVYSYTFKVVSKKPSVQSLLPTDSSRLESYMMKRTGMILHFCEKFNYDSGKLREKLINRESKLKESGTVFETQNKFDNFTDRWIANILVNETNTRLTEEQIVKELKN